MKLEELIGKEIIDILICYRTESYGLDEADCFLILDKNLTIGFPYSIDDEAWVRESDTLATSIFSIPKRSQETAGIGSIKGSRIIDFIEFSKEVSDRAFIVLSNGVVITEVTVAPHGTGLAGLTVFESIQQLEARFDGSYHRLSEKRSAPNKE